jgi:hypothetical protein
MLEQHEGRGERGVPAQIHLGDRREPAQLVNGAGADQESRLGEVVLGGDRLHRPGIRPAREQTHGRRVAGKDPVGERVDLK